MNEHILAMGIDLGTTSVSAAVIDITDGSQLEFFTKAHNADVACADSAFHEQDAELICRTAIDITEEIFGKYPAVRSVGLTGQMHGIVYIDKNGNAVSNLINWQDRRGDCSSEKGRTYCEEMIALTAQHIAAGYGLASHFYNVRNGLVPSDAVTFCSIMDYLGMKLTGSSTPVMHTSVAASFGLFDIGRCAFRTDALHDLGLDKLKIPEVTDEYMCIGKYRGAGVSVAIGDNQASILGSVKDADNSVLVNIGTGSQISMVSESMTATEAIEIRPLTKGRSIACASALCGGSAYALLESFFREYTAFAGYSAESQYDVLNRLIEKAAADRIAPLHIDTAFLGKRHDPVATGSITGITCAGFTPGAMALGFIHGICRELYEHFEGRMDSKRMVVASGNAVQRIPAFRRVLSDMFSMPVMISANKEEAALGAALFGCAANDMLRLSDFGSFIHYKED